VTTPSSPKRLGPIVCANLEKLMAKKGLTPANIADPTPVRVANQEGREGPRTNRTPPPNEKTIRRILAGEIANPRPSTLQGIADALGIKVEQLTSPIQSLVHQDPDDSEAILLAHSEEQAEDPGPAVDTGAQVEKISLTRIGRVRDLEPFFGEERPSVHKVYSLELTEDDEDWAAQLVDQVVRTSRAFKDRWYKDPGFGEVAKRDLLKKIFATISERPPLGVFMGTTRRYSWDKAGEPISFKILFIGVAPAAKPMNSCLYYPADDGSLEETLYPDD